MFAFVVSGFDFFFAILFTRRFSLVPSVLSALTPILYSIYVYVTCFPYVTYTLNIIVLNI
jgi:hypothetical protein